MIFPGSAKTGFLNLTEKATAMRTESAKIERLKHQYQSNLRGAKRQHENQLVTQS